MRRPLRPLVEGLLGGLAAGDAAPGSKGEGADGGTDNEEDVEPGVEVGELHPPREGALQAALSPDGSLICLARVGANGAAVVKTSSAFVAEIEGTAQHSVAAASWSHDGLRVACGGAAPARRAAPPAREAAKPMPRVDADALRAIVGDMPNVKKKEMLLEMLLDYDGLPPGVPSFAGR